LFLAFIFLEFFEMGYYTKYNIKITGIDNANQAVKIARDYDLVDYVVSDTGTVLIAFYEGKWYVWEKESVALTRNYPRILIKIYGEGEESGDIWKARIRNGECERVEAKIVFDEFKSIK
jgi:hypothetical protein